MAFALHIPGGMLRRAIFVAVLLSPMAGRAAPAAGSVITAPTSFGSADCTSTSATVTFEWTLTLTSGTTVIPADSFIQIRASNKIDCPDTGTDTQTALFAPNVTPGTSTTYGATTTVLRKTLITGAGLDACNTNSTIYVCVKLYNSGGGTVLGSASGTVALTTAAPVAPIGVVASPGEAALNVSWSDGTGTSTSGAATDYLVEAWPCPLGSDDTCVGSKATGTTSSKSLRLPGLTIGTRYKVVVYAFSAEGNKSPASAPAFETPIDAIDFWEKYKEMKGLEEGGCAGGPAGVLSLLAVAGLVRTRRRRP